VKFIISPSTNSFDGGRPDVVVVEFTASRTQSLIISDSLPACSCVWHHPLEKIESDSEKTINLGTAKFNHGPASGLISALLVRCPWQKTDLSIPRARTKLLYNVFALLLGASRDI
jgi:hypothetical protein